MQGGCGQVGAGGVNGGMHTAGTAAGHLVDAVVMSCCSLGGGIARLW